MQERRTKVSSRTGDYEVPSLRRRTILLDARLSGPHGDGLCRIHALSGYGLTAQTVTLLGRHDWVRIGLHDGLTVAGQVQWAADDHIGVTFAAPIDDRSPLLARAVSYDGGVQRMPPPAPRFATRSPVALWQGDTTHAATMLDVSERGARLAITTHLRAGRPLHVSIPGLHLLLSATLRWTSASAAGIAFDTPLPFDTLAPWLDTPSLRFAD